MQENIKTIENLLKAKYQTWFTVSLDKFSYIITPDNREELASILDCEVDSEDFLFDLNKIETAVNLIF